jgi:hypothetical protein
MSDSFGVFCKNCGSYNVDLFITPEQEAVFECLVCEEKEYIEVEK